MDETEEDRPLDAADMEIDIDSSFDDERSVGVGKDVKLDVGVLDWVSLLGLHCWKSLTLRRGS